MKKGFVVALLGAESSGKSTLARELAAALVADGRTAVAIDEGLRGFVAEHGRTPHRDEQAALAREQTERIVAAGRDAEIVVADTTALMVAVYSDLVFEDGGLYEDAEKTQRGYELTLLTALDLPWVADGLQRDGEHVRASVDERIRAALERAQIAFEVIAGSGPVRLDAALAAVRFALARRR